MTKRNIRNTPVLEVGDKSILLKPSIGCMADIEDKTGKTITSFVQLIAEAQLSLNDTITIITEGSKAAGNEMSRNDIEELIGDYGVLIVQEALVDFLGVAMYGGKTFDKESKKKVKAEKQ